MSSISWQEGDTITMEITRDGEPQTLEGEVAAPMLQARKIVPMENTTQEQEQLRNAWLKN